MSNTNSMCHDLTEESCKGWSSQVYFSFLIALLVGIPSCTPSPLGSPCGIIWEHWFLVQKMVILFQKQIQELCSAVDLVTPSGVTACQHWLILVSSDAPQLMMGLHPDKILIS